MNKSKKRFETYRENFDKIQQAKFDKQDQIARDTKNQFDKTFGSKFDSLSRGIDNLIKIFKKNGI